MSTATLTEPKASTREDGVSGYAVMLMNANETSKREPVHIISHFCEHHEVTLSVDRPVKLTSTHATNRVAVFTDRDVEMIGYDVNMPKGGTVIIYPVGHKPGDAGTETH